MMPENHDTDIQQALVPAPMDGPGDDLYRRLRVLGRETVARRPFWRSPAFGPALVTGGVGAVFAVTALLPAKASAKTFDLILAAAQNVNAFQFSIHANEDGKRQHFTIAGDGQRVYMHSSEGEAFEIDGASMSIYDPKERKVTRMKFPKVEGTQDIMKEIQSGMAQGLKEMDLKKMLRDYRAKYGTAGVKIGPVIPENGHSVYHVWLSSPQEPERVEMTVDAATDLPERLQVAARDGSVNWTKQMDMELRFGVRVDASLLHSSIPAGVKVEEIDLQNMVGDAMKGIGKAFEDAGKEIKERP